jgi:GTP pyrophosphokinase
VGKIIDTLKGKSSRAIQIGGVDDVMVRFGKCCNPLPGDEIIGFITRGRGVTVHSADCALALGSDPERRVEIVWSRDKKSALPAKIRVTCHDQKGILANISQAITNCEANIISAHIQSTVDRMGVNIFEVEVTDIEHLRQVMNAIQKLAGVNHVERLRG